ncbi:MAG: hypothetical protein IT470_04315, partial [Pseudomonadales bacterium]|nr:hypothetical protein [Pseudomonadales bacterium]
MRNLSALVLLMAAVGLMGCSYDDGGRYGGHDHDGGYYGGGGSYGGGYRSTPSYEYYYPYGNAYYPRDRIWIVNNYSGCPYYSYRGYCYRDKDDFERAVYWDRQHGYDDHWYRKREEWCRHHDCHRDHETRDAKGRPIQQPVDKNKPVNITRPYRSDPVPVSPVESYDRSSRGRYDRDDRYDRGNRYDRDDVLDSQGRPVEQPVIRRGQMDNSTRPVYRQPTSVESSSGRSSSWGSDRGSSSRGSSGSGGWSGSSSGRSSVESSSGA